MAFATTEQKNKTNEQKIRIQAIEFALAITYELKSNGYISTATGILELAHDVEQYIKTGVVGTSTVIAVDNGTPEGDKTAITTAVYYKGEDKSE